MNEKWLIWSNEHKAWWLPPNHGYTQKASEAGRYCFEDAVTICTDANSHGWYKEGMISAGTAYVIKVPYETMVPESSLPK